jgi:hypothetical protein
VKEEVPEMQRAGAIWYQECKRWGQTNLTEIDPIRYDNAWWRNHWKRTSVQGVIINAGGIVAYYPSNDPLHHRADHLGDRDLFGEIVAEAREDGLSVIARMDSNRADARFYHEHPDWFAVDASGRPYRAGELFIACVNSPYYDIFIPNVLREVIERYRPDGFADNSWSGLQRDRICYCVHCQKAFREHAGAALPNAHDWDDPVYRAWIRWSYDRRIAIWDINNRTTKTHGGEHCLWIGMNAGDLIAQGKHFRDYRAIAERSELIFLDSQYRHPGMGFQRNGEAGALLHGILGWDNLIPESMAMYGAGQPSFRLASKPAADARLWALEGFAGTIQPWWHHIGAYHEDRRQYTTAEPLFTWHREHEQYLANRRPVASVGVVWSQENVDVFGRDRPEDQFRMPWNGLTDALIRARIPYLPVHADHIERDCTAHNLATLVLPNVGALSDSQCEAIRRFVAAGGGVVATGETSRFDERGQKRDDFGLADVFGAHATGVHLGASTDDRQSWDEWAQHTYLRIAPERRRWVYGPSTGAEPDDDAPRHRVFAGFEDTDVLPFGGRLEVVHPADGAQVPMTLIPPFPIYPPETSWMRHPTSTVPALVVNERPGQGRVAYLAADIDRTFGRGRLPDHAHLLANLVRWSANDQVPIDVEGSGLLHCQLYRQDDRHILHIVNLSGQETGFAPAYEFYPAGPVTIRIATETAATHAKLLVAGAGEAITTRDGRAKITVPSIADHEVIVIEAR